MLTVNYYTGTESRKGSGGPTWNFSGHTFQYCILHGDLIIVVVLKMGVSPGSGVNFTQFDACEPLCAVTYSLNQIY